MCPGLHGRTLCATRQADDHLGRAFYLEMVISTLACIRVADSRRQCKSERLCNRQGSNVNVIYTEQINLF